MYGFILLLLGGSDQLGNLTPEVLVDRLELQHVHHANQDPTKPPPLAYRQWILWRWSPSRQRFCVLDWCMADRVRWTLSRSRGDWLLVVSAEGRLYRVRARTFRETWGMVDSEVLARELEWDWERPDCLPR